MKKPNKDQEMLTDELAFAQRQVEAGQTALLSDNLDTKVAARVVSAVKYWETRCTTIQQELTNMAQHLDTVEQDFVENL
jgi:phage shock protein A